MVWPYVTGSIEVADVQALLATAASDLLDFSTAFEIRDANRDVGAPVTFVTLRNADGEVTHAVHALQTPSDPEIVGVADAHHRPAGAHRGRARPDQRSVRRAGSGRRDSPCP